ncbi:hypothetical protein BRADI_1g64395v3 [Brachypodium distachyon]|uniref:Uncharacterized protein n=1 Tax=Brachypodium distachyon TaxID=15368 RepID=A0A2K2DTD1_BRADI|nr:hypothetical protein BRADI_1g64395v3 [Brachypodium distachyon]
MGPTRPCQHRVSALPTWIGSGPRVPRGGEPRHGRVGRTARHDAGEHASRRRRTGGAAVRHGAAQARGQTGGLRHSTARLRCGRRGRARVTRGRMGCVIDYVVRAQLCHRPLRLFGNPAAAVLCLRGSISAGGHPVLGEVKQAPALAVKRSRRPGRRRRRAPRPSASREHPA